MRFDNLRRRLDWGLSYYRSSSTVGLGIFTANQLIHIYQANVNYPLNEVQSFRLAGGIRRDIYNIKSDDLVPGSLEQQGAGCVVLLGDGRHAQERDCSDCNNAR